jgi:hypothetical protein
MTGHVWLDALISVLAALLLIWLALAVTLLIVRPRGGLLREALRLLPDVLRLLRRLAADRTLPRGVRVRLALLLAYLALPFDPIPTSSRSSATPTMRSSSPPCCAVSFGSLDSMQSEPTGPAPTTGSPPSPASPASTATPLDEYVLSGPESVTIRQEARARADGRFG